MNAFTLLMMAQRPADSGAFGNSGALRPGERRVVCLSAAGNLSLWPAAPVPTPVRPRLPGAAGMTETARP